MFDLFDDDRGVSPVIGVMLMVSVAVVLTAFAGSFVFSLDSNGAGTGVEADFDFEFTNDPNGHDSLTIRYVGDETLNGDNLNVTVTGAANESGAPAVHSADDFAYPKVETGDRNTVDASDFRSAGIADPHAPGKLDLDAATVRIVWTSPETGRSKVLAVWTGPDA